MVNKTRGKQQSRGSADEIVKATPSHTDSQAAQNARKQQGIHQRSRRGSNLQSNDQSFTASTSPASTTISDDTALESKTHRDQDTNMSTTTFTDINDQPAKPKRKISSISGDNANASSPENGAAGNYDNSQPPNGQSPSAASPDGPRDTEVDLAVDQQHTPKRRRTAGEPSRAVDGEYDGGTEFDRETLQETLSKLMDVLEEKDKQSVLTYTTTVPRRNTRSQQTPTMTVEEVRKKLDRSRYASLREFQMDFDALFAGVFSAVIAGSKKREAAERLHRLGARLIQVEVGRLQGKRQLRMKIEKVNGEGVKKEIEATEIEDNKEEVMSEKEDAMEGDEQEEESHKRKRGEGRRKGSEASSSESANSEQANYPPKRDDKIAVFQITPEGQYLFTSLQKTHVLSNKSLELPSGVHKLSIVPTPPLQDVPSLRHVMPNMSRPPPRRHGEGDRIVTPVRFLNYGPFSSFGPTMDSYQANISYEDTAYVADILRQKRADKMERARRRAEAAAAAAAEKQAALGVVSGSGNGSKSGSGNKSGSGGSSGGSTSVAEEKVQKAPEKGEDDAAPLDVEGKILSGKDNSGSGEDVVAMEIDGVDGMEKTDKANEVMELAKVTEATEAAEAAEAAVIMDKGKGKEKEKEKEKEEALDTGANADADAIKDNVPSDAAVSTESVEPAAVAVDTEWLKGLGLDAELILKGIEELNHEDNNDKLDGPDLAEVLQQNTEQLMELVRLQEERFSRLKGWDISWREKETANNLHKQLALLTSKIPPNLVASPQAIETAMARIPYKETAYRGSLPPNRPFAFLSNIARPEAVPSNATAQPSYPLSHPHSKPVAIPPINYAKYPVHGTTYASAQGATPASTPVSTPAPHTAQAGPSTPTPTPMMPATRSRRGSMSGTQTPTSTNPLTQPVASYPSTPNQFYHMASSQSGMTSSQQYLQQQQASQQQAAMHPLQMSSQQSRHHHQQQQQQQYQQSYPTTPQQHSAYQDYTPTTTAQNQPAYSPAATPSYPVSNGMTTPQRTQPAAAVTPVQYAPSLAPPQQSPQVRQSSPQPYGLAYDQDALMLDPNGRNRWRTAVDGQGCANCGATKTPIWRAGSNGDKLCNACGLYFSKTGGKEHRPASHWNSGGMG